MKAKKNAINSKQSLYQIFLDLKIFFKHLSEIRSRSLSSSIYDFDVEFCEEYSSIRISAPSVLEVPMVISVVRSMGFSVDAIEDNIVSVYFYGDYEATKYVYLI